MTPEQAAIAYCKATWECDYQLALHHIAINKMVRPTCDTDVYRAFVAAQDAKSEAFNRWCKASEISMPIYVAGGWALHPNEKINAVIDTATKEKP